MNKFIISLFSLVCAFYVCATPNVSYEMNDSEKTSVYHSKANGETLYVIRRHARPVLIKQKQIPIGEHSVRIRWYKFNLDASRWEEIEPLIDMEM